MSRDFIQDHLEHSWGKKPSQKAREKQYNKEYYRKHKDKWKDLYNKHWDDDIRGDIDRMKQLSTDKRNYIKEMYKRDINSRYNDRDKLRLDIRSNSEIANDPSQSDYSRANAAANARRLRNIDISSGQAENERAKEALRNKKAADTLDEKNKVYKENYEKDTKKREKAERVKTAIEEGAKFVANLIGNVYGSIASNMTVNVNVSDKK